MGLLKNVTWPLPPPCVLRGCNRHSRCEKKNRPWNLLGRTLYTKLYDIFPVWCWIHNIEECFGDFKTGLALRSVQGVLMAVPTVWINLETPKTVELLVRMHILSRIFSPRLLLFYDNLNLILTELEEVRKKGIGGWK